MLTRSIISVIQSQFHQLHVLCSTMEPRNSESSIRRMQNFGNLVIMRRSRFFFPKGGVGVGPRDSLICQERGVWGSEVFHRPLYHFEFTRGGGRVRTYIEPPSRYAHINYRQFEKAIFWIPFFFFWSSFVALSKKRLSMTGSKHPADKPDRKSCSVCSRYYLFSKIK